MTDEPRKVGRPTLYTPELGEKIVAHMSRGLSLTAAAANEDVHRERVYDWEKVHPDFAELVALARAKRQAWLEDQITTTTMGPRVTAMIFALKNANPKEWADRNHTEITGKDGGPIESKTVLDVSGMSEEELAVLVKVLERK